MEVRFFVPGNLVCNLDFVESIFGNAGDPLLPENDSCLLYTSDAADERSSVDLGGRRIIKKKNTVKIYRTQDTE